jgi:hypothetical protein
VNNKLYLIPSADFLMLAILNSIACWWYLGNTATKLRGGAYQMQTPYVSGIPIPVAPAGERAAVSALVQKCLDARGQGTGVADWEAEINERVARLYGLTAEEKKIVEDATA